MVSIDSFREALGVLVLPWWVVALLRGVLLLISSVGAQATQVWINLVAWAASICLFIWDTTGALLLHSPFDSAGPHNIHLCVFRLRVVYYLLSGGVEKHFNDHLSQRGGNICRGLLYTQLFSIWSTNGNMVQHLPHRLCGGFTRGSTIR